MKKQKSLQSQRTKLCKGAMEKMLQNSISYGYYFNDYSMGQKPILTSEQFAVFEVRARRFLKGICSEQIPNENLDDVFACVCALAEELYLQKDSHIKSENTDGYSVTYADGQGGRKKLFGIANLYLGHLGILYAGVE